ncbi:hypothetical protein PR202_gb04630 [Eleusine coracana subsp. coracana]|uniref:Uncharacterized protein n=2 Tax=Eleusine coracana subsp. coracana TaxID=191504 RepID=A0AAV9FVN0_ELECO|nr:hypothetical protein QOZ80_UnG0727800 [Eleusine coracana subsp. coracana]KAK3162037.1 hypothetical protein QOZ80_1BG0084490 [Eleusine coracana subsp. coracana]KAK3162041.1 hypothetical protein QOZ80_1BG0084550 [Eleusine coracana subsp. coracana]GJN17553.1 hypothetical protein PR202_gb04630 [Eleusine coracana subsp. coracana]
MSSSSSFQQQQQEMQMEKEMSISSSAPSPCVKDCGFFGSPGTMNMCFVCFTKHLQDTAPAPVEAPKAEDAVVDVMEEKTTAAAPAPVPPSVPSALTDAEIKKMQDRDWQERCRKAKENDYYKNRCAECYKKMGLAMRFECRCGKVCCLSHRNSEAHHCSFNYQRAGVISIIRDNPVVQADKLRDRI